LELWRKKSTRTNTQKNEKKNEKKIKNEKGRKSHIILGEVFFKQEELKTKLFLNEYLKGKKK
jgi:hypothetical protein